MVWTVSWCVNSRIARVRLQGEVAQLRAEVALLREELRIKDARMARIAPRARPHYPPPERLAILLLKAARAWSSAQTARRFLLTAPTVADWQRRLEREGESSLVALPVPVNRFPELVREVTRRLETLMPAMGCRRIADVLARAGLHLSKSSVKRYIEQQPRPEGDVPQPEAPGVAAGEAGASVTADAESQRTVTAKRPNHVWNADLTMVPLLGGLWVPWFPLALPPVWPFCWWVAAIVDHYSRRVVAWRVFWGQPTADQVVGLLDYARVVSGGAPKYMVTDQGAQFREEYQAWCTAHGVRPRYGAVGRYGSVAVIERFWATLKGEGLRRLAVLPMRYEGMRREVELFIEWYNAERPHSSLGGRTPDEAYFQTAAARDGPRFECRARWPLSEEVTLRAEQGAAVQLAVTFLEGRRHLPLVELKRAA
jgi:putative transposase